MSRIMKWVSIAFLWSTFFAAKAQANIVNAASCSSSDVQAAINSANSGDTVQVPVGVCTWSSVVIIPNTKAITLNGGGATIKGALTVNQNSSFTTRVTNFIFLNNSCVGGTTCLAFNGTTTSAPFRFDHNTVTNLSAATMIQVSGNAPGLIDHNTFTAGASAEMIHNMGLGAGNSGGWVDDIVPGSSNMLFLEDNTFTYNATGAPAYFLGTSAIQSYYGARTVVRHNTMNMVHVDQHGTCGSVYARWWEIYNNTFNTLVANANQSDYVRVRGGSGVIFGNTHVGTNLGAGSIQLAEDCTSGTYPLPDQVGRGIKQTSSPAYVWGNGSDMPVGSGNATYVQLGRDFFAAGPSNITRCESAADVSAGCPVTYNYVPYTYPHPLQNTPPSPPSNLTLVIN